MLVDAPLFAQLRKFDSCATSHLLPAAELFAHCVSDFVFIEFRHD